MADIDALDVRVSTSGDQATADRIKKMVSDLNDVIDAASDGGLAVKLHLYEGMIVNTVGRRSAFRSAPTLTVEVVRPL